MALVISITLLLLTNVERWLRSERKGQISESNGDKVHPGMDGITPHKTVL